MDEKQQDKQPRYDSMSDEYTYPLHTGSDASMIWELQLQDLLDDIEKKLSGTQTVIDNGVPVDRECPELRLINNKGIRYIQSRLVFVVNKWTALSMTERAHVMKFTRHYIDGIQKEMRIRHSDFEIEIWNFESVIMGLAEVIMAGLSKSINEGERRYRRAIERRQVIYNSSSGSKKKGLLDSMKGVFKV
jgi:hypothetical protein